MSKKRPIAFNIGTSSILSVFILLALATFAALSLASANADYRLSSALKSRNTAYYEASNQAELKLADIDAVLAGCYAQSDSPESYFSLAAGQLGISDNHTLEWREDISKGQTLLIQLTILYPAADMPYYYRTDSWRIEQTDTETEDNTLNLLDMEAENP